MECNRKQFFYQRHSEVYSVTALPAGTPGGSTYDIVIMQAAVSHISSDLEHIFKAQLSKGYM